VREGISNTAKHCLEHLCLPRIDETAIFLANEIVDVVGGTFLISESPAFQIADDFYTAFKRANSVKRCGTIPVVAPINGFLDLKIDIRKSRVSNNSPEWLRYLRTSNLVVR